MINTSNLRNATVILATAFLMTGTYALAQAVTSDITQELDRVLIRAVNIDPGSTDFGEHTVLDMPFEDRDRTQGYLETGISGSDFKACSLTGLDGLFCIDGRVVRNWPSPARPDDYVDLFSCEDSALGFDTRREPVCTALTVPLDGSIWLAGKDRRGPTFKLTRNVPPVDGVCPPGTTGLQGGLYCTEEVDRDKPLILDLSSVDGDVGANFPLAGGQGGVLYIQDRKTAVFQPANGSTAIEIASGKQGFNLEGGENDLQGIALWQSLDGEKNHVLVVTENGRIISIEVFDDGSFGPPVEAFDIEFERTARDPLRDPVATQCEFEGDPAYALRASAKSGLVYATDRQYCEVLALEYDSTPASFDLDNAQEVYFALDPDTGDPVLDPVTGDPVPDGTKDLTLSTAGTTTYTAGAPTVAPGISIDLRDCGIFCDVLFNEAGDPIYTYANVVLADGPSGLTVFQIKNIPDCRYIPQTCIDDLLIPDAVVDPGGTGMPEAQLLNLTKLLPVEITDQFDVPLPPMYLGQTVRGQRHNDFRFEAFFGVTESGVVFRDYFTSTYDVESLAGSELGCHLGLPFESPLTTADPAVAPFGTLEFDVASTVSEVFISPTDPALVVPDPDPSTDLGLEAGEQRISTMTNFADCGTTKGIGVRFSIKPYNLEPAYCTSNRDLGDVWQSDGDCPLPPAGDPSSVVETPDDAVFFKLLFVLFDELGRTIDDLACVDADGNLGVPPLGASACSTAQASWANAKDKLDKCWNASQQPKQSSGAQNCQAYKSQVSGLASFIDGLAPNGTDVANRLGELRGRLLTIDFVYEERVVPSLPATGFCEPGNPNHLGPADQDCSSP